MTPSQTIGTVVSTIFFNVQGEDKMLATENVQDE
jgi:hypothetical protein